MSDTAGAHGLTTESGTEELMRALFCSTTDTSFVENPPTPRKPPGKSTPAPPSVSSSRTASVSHRGSSQIGRGRGVPVVRGTRAGSLAAAARETGVNRGRGRGVIR